MPEPTQHNIRRYPGLGPFKKEEQMLFFGRNLEIQELLYSIKVHNVFVLFGMSGLGKSSLVNAGLLPALEEEDLQAVEIKFQQQKEDRERAGTAQPSNTLVRSALQELETFINTDKLAQAPATDKDHLWLYLHCWKDRSATPLLVFDQFEQFFNYPEPLRQALIGQLADVIRGRLPENLRQGMSGISGKESLTPEMLSWMNVPKAKFLFVIRSDKLNLMDDLTKTIPDILSNRYQLKPLTRAQAREAIVNPAQIWKSDEWPFESDPFEYNKAAVDMIIDTLSDKSSEIDTSQLQVICHAIENKIAAQQQAGKKDIIVNASDFGEKAGLQKMQKEFYNGQMNKLMQKFPAAFPTIQLLLEEQFLYKNTGIRLSVLEDEAIDFLKTEGKENAEDEAREIIGEMVKLRLIRDEVNTKGRFYEVSHDTLVAPILQSREERKRNDRTAIRQSELAAADAALKKCLKLFEDEQYPEAMTAINEARSILEKYPDELQKRTEAEILLAKCFEAQKEPDAARQILDKLLQRLHAEGRVDLQGQVFEAIGSLWEEQENYEKAKELYEVALTSYKSSASYQQFAQLAEHLAGLIESYDTIPHEAGFSNVSYYYAQALDHYKTLKDRIGTKRVQHALDRLELASKSDRTTYIWLTNLLTGEVHKLGLKRDKTVFIGRNTDTIQNDLGIQMSFVSRRHISINSNYVIEDLQSLNGTTLNANLLEYGNAQTLQHNDIICLAGVLPLLFSKEPPPPLEVPAGTWGVWINAEERSFTHLTGIYYSLTLKDVSENKFTIGPVKQEKPKPVLELVNENDSVKMLCRPIPVDDQKKWTFCTPLKGEGRTHEFYLLKEEEWVIPLNSPIRFALVKFDVTPPTILENGPWIQLILKEYSGT
ncbi:MAG TPA: FHA domain-containing protein [Chitinophagaceae bacterium]|nr:FHA domain-containing protein [Chitinophagaceae bacterium]